MNILEPEIEIRYRNNQNRTMREALIAGIRHNTADCRNERFFELLTDYLLTFPRLFLYLPFELIMTSPDWAKRGIYRKMFFELLKDIDYRESFNTGDIYEEGARREDPELVIKVAHMLPFLVEAGVLLPKDVSSAIKTCTTQRSLLSNIGEGLVAARKMHISIAECDEFAVAIEAIRDRSEKLPPIYVSCARQKWLEEKNQTQRVEFGHILCDFVRNLPVGILEKSIDNSDDCIVVIAGSRLKGYSSDLSDLDIFHYDQKRGDIRECCDELYSQKVHFIYNTAWVSKTLTCDQMQALRSRMAEQIWAQDDKQQYLSLLRLESDLLQWRLMHKGFPKAFSDISARVKSIEEIDGSSAFYDDRYRTVASELYVRYVWFERS